MTRSARAALAAVLSACVVSSSANAYNDDPDADGVFPPWMCAEPVAPVFAFNSACVFYEVHQTGAHTAEVHFRNISNATMHFDWWLAGRQRPGENARVTLRPFFETKEELRRPAALSHGRPGLTLAPLRMYAVRRGPDDAGTAVAPLAAVEEPAMPPEDWMPATSVRDPGVVRRSGLLVRLAREDGRATIAFRNPQARPLHFRFAVPALGIAGMDRVAVPANGDVTLPLRDAQTRQALPLLRVLVSDLRVGDDTGATYAPDRSNDAEWFPPTMTAGTAALPGESLLANVEALGTDRARVRFRSRVATPIRMRFALPEYQGARADTEVVVPASGEVESIVPLAKPVDARLALTRVRAWDVVVGE